jgi:hypothetical protein
MPCFSPRLFPLYLFGLLTVNSFAQSRVDDQLVSLYTFHEGEGVYVHDVAGFDTPLTLRIENAENATWVSGGGLEITSPTIIKSFTGANKVSESVMQSGELTMEAWIVPVNTSQDGPARISTISWGSGDRNMTLGQEANSYVARVRTMSTSDNGTPQTAFSSTVTTNLQHLVYTLDTEGQESFYIDGLLAGTDTRSGGLGNWNVDYPLAIANEIGADRAWLGTLHLVGFYSKALNADEVQTNYESGHQQVGPTVSTETCDQEFCYVNGYDSDQRVLWFASFPQIHHRFKFDENGGHLDVFEDGTAHLYGQTINMEEPEYGLFMDIWFQDRMQWEAWSALGRSWKGDPDIVGDNYLEWDYYIMDPDIDNVLVGTGDLEGALLHLTHHPISYYYGFQVGTAANALNDEPGMSCWFDYEGELFDEWVSGNGDVNMEGECSNPSVLQCASDAVINCDDPTHPDFTGYAYVSCPEEYSLTYTDVVISAECPISIERTWTAQNELGESVTCVQMITADDTTPPEIAPGVVLLDCDLELTAVVVDDCDTSPNYTLTILDSTWTNGVDCELTQLRTQTPGGWGSPPNGNNPGAYLHAHFESAFPDGLTVGCNNQLVLETAQDITEFLPSGGTPAALPEGVLVNPGQDYSNTLASHVVALSLSAGFDAYSPDFGFDDFLLADAIIQSGEFLGWTVADVLELGNSVLGGCPTEYNASTLTDVISQINENYVDGEMDNGFLDCSLPWDCYLEYMIEVAAIDACGNESTLVTSAYFIDDSEIMVEDFEEEITVTCGQVPDPEIEILGGCLQDLFTVEVEDIEFSGNCYPTVQRTYTVVDACGNQATFTQFIVVVDLVAPVFLNSPENGVISCGDEYPTFEPEVFDNCDPDPLVTYSEEIESAGCMSFVLRTWTASDLCGNFTSVQQELTVIDDLAPEALEFDPELEVDCADIPTTEIAFVDECSGVASVDLNEVQIGEGCDYDIVRTWTATDLCGNVATAVQVLHVSDAEAPLVVNVPADVSILCGMPLPEDEPIATDNCGAVTVSYSEEELDGEGCGQVIRTWVYSDDCLNETEVQQVVTLVDAIAPELSALPEDIIGNCGDLAAVPSVVATDNCDVDVEVIFEEEIADGECGVIITRTWTATDQCGNTTEHVQTLDLQDNQPPQISASPEITTGCETAFNNDLIEVIDDCSFAVLITYEDEVVGGGCSYDINRVWTVVDPCGNTATFDQLIHVSDSSGPAFFDVPEDVTLPCGANVPDDQPTVEDSCSDADMIYTEIWDTEGCLPILERVWMAQDACGNVSSAVQVVSFIDDTPPIIADVPEDQMISCTDPIDPASMVTVIDACDDEPVITFEENIIPGDCANSYSIQRTWTATDACGNTASATQLIDVIDDTAPVFDAILEDLEVPCGEIPEPAVVSATDNCGGEVTVVLEEITDSGGCPNITRIYTATDACGNSAVMVQVITVLDTEPPLLLGIPDDVEVSCGMIPDMPDPEVSDNCDDNVAVTVNESIVGSGCEFIIMRTWIASDDCGNTTIASQSISVFDEEPPVFVDAPDEITVECSEIDGIPYPTVLDDCGNTVIITFEDQALGAGCEYDIERTYTATDLCGHTAQAVMIIHVVDLTPPVIQGVSGNQYVDCSSIPNPDEVVAVDECSEVVDVVFVETQTGEGCDYMLSRSWTATDECGNAMTIAHIIYVSDEQGPEITGVPEDLVLDCEGEIPPPAVPTVTDNCDDDVVLNFIEFTENTDCDEVVTRIWSATDDCGNSSSALQTITITDLTPPQILGVPADIEVTCNAIPDPATVSTFDECSPDVELTLEDIVVTGECPYTIERTWTAVDGCGNVATAIQSILVVDNEAPVLSAFPEDVTVGCGDIPEVELITATDNCMGFAPVMFEETTLPGECLYVITRVWTATDLCGNVAQHVQHIYLQDEEAPVFPITPADVDVECHEVEPMPYLEAIDDCGDVAVTMQEIIDETFCANEYTAIRIWTATDACGNVSQVTQIVNVYDSSAPQIIDFPNDTTVACGELPDVPELAIEDNCDNEVEVEFIEEVVLLEEDDGSCQLGNAVSLSEEVAIWLPSLSGYGSNYIFGEAGVFTQNMATGTAHLHGQVYNVDNANESWIMDIDLEDAMGWEQWSADGGSYKDDMGLAGDNYLDWTYFKLAEGTLTGTGDFEGAVLTLTHAPANFTYGFQLGVAANNRNAEYGMSGWFFYDGEINGEAVTGVGDVIVEMDCCPDQEVTRTWMLTDCAGNTSVYTQNIYVGDNFEFTPLIYPDYPGLAIEVDPLDEGQFRIHFNSDESGRAQIALFDAVGNQVDVILENFIERDQDHVIIYDNSKMEAGFYVFRISQHGDVASDVEVRVN